MEKKKFVAEVKNQDGNIFEVEGWATTPQEFHKIVMMEHIDYITEEIQTVKTMIPSKNDKGQTVYTEGNVVYSLNIGFKGNT